MLEPHVPALVLVGLAPPTTLISLVSLASGASSTQRADAPCTLPTCSVTRPRQGVLARRSSRVCSRLSLPACAVPPPLQRSRLRSRSTCPRCPRCPASCRRDAPTPRYLGCLFDALRRLPTLRFFLCMRSLRVCRPQSNTRGLQPPNNMCTHRRERPCPTASDLSCLRAASSSTAASQPGALTRRLAAPADLAVP